MSWSRITLVAAALLVACSGTPSGERSCRSVLECRAGESCVDGLCQPAGATPDSTTPGPDTDAGEQPACRIDADCASLGAGYRCEQSRCLPPVCPCGPEDPCTATTPDCWQCERDEDCEDQDPCTVNACTGRLCTFTPIDECCAQDADCDDANPCTNDTCPNYRCLHQSIPGCCQLDRDCDDGDPCTVDACAEGTCRHESLGDHCCDADNDCDDGDPCTTDACRQGRCVHPRTSDEPRCGCVDFGDMCDDNNPCSDDVCDEFTRRCAYTAAGVPPAGVRCCTTASGCNDGDPATEDLCENFTCVHVSRPACQGHEQCATAFPCHAGICFEGYCNRGQAIAGCCVRSSDCDDGDTCTVDLCDGNGRCQNTFQLGPGCCSGRDSDCDDGLDCSQDYCCRSSGGCCGGTGGGPICVPMNHCYHFVQPGTDCCASDVECDDDYPCTLDICVGGDCLNILVTEACCERDEDCDDGDTCTVDACVMGECRNGAIPGCCESDLDCDDGNPCTTGQCVGQRCAFQYIAGCCLEDRDCNDDDVCTTDTCSLEGQCQHQAFSPCCVADSDCRSSDICRIGRCQSEVCAYERLAGCCHTASECDDGDACTIDECMANRCHRTPLDSPECCQSETLFDNAGFERFGTLSFEFEEWDLAASSPPIGWKVVANGRSQSPPHSLFYGQSPGGTYASGFAHQGYARTPLIALPDASPIFASFWTWLDFGGAEYPFGRFEVSVSSSTGDTVLWTAAPFQGDTTPDFRFIELDLSPWRNQTVRMKFHFATTWTQTSGGEGVYVDDLVVGSGCTVSPVDCQTDPDCADNDPCTVESCVDQSCVVTTGDQATCCAPRSFAATFDNGTLQGFSTGLVEGASPRFSWVTSTHRSQTAPYSLYFGDPSLSCVDTEGLCPAYGDPSLPGSAWPGGTADFGPVDLTNLGRPALSFAFWGQIEPTFGLDDMRVLVLQPPFEPGLERATEVWSAVSSGLMSVNADSQKLETGGFVPVVVDLSAFAPGLVKIRFLFDSSESGYGYAEGVYLDDVTVGTDCR